MPLENRMIEKMNEMTMMVTDKSNISESGIRYVKDLFAEIIKSGMHYDTDEVDAWLKNEGSWKNADVRNRIVNISHYVQSRHEQSDKFRIIKDDSCSCGSD